MTDAVTDADDDAWPLIQPEALLRCRAVLAAAAQADARAADRLAGLLGALQHALQQRLRDQLAQLPDAAARACLLNHVPHWRQVARLTGMEAV